MPPGPVLRPTGPFDLQLLAALHARCFTAEWDQSWTAASFAEILAMPGAAGLLLSVAEEPLGFAITSTVLDEMEIILLAIRPDRRQAGLGSFLVGAVIEQAKAQKIAAIFLEYAAPNLAAARLYLAAGFRQIGLRRNYYRDLDQRPIDAVTMRLELGAGASSMPAG